VLALVLDELKAVGAVSTVKHQHFTNLERDVKMFETKLRGEQNGIKKIMLLNI
jgi:hypothetical protein